MKQFLTLLFMLIVSLSAFSADKPKTSEIVLTSDNLITLRGPFTAASTGEIMEKAKQLDSKLQSGYPIYLFLMTPGGSIQAGLQLFEFLKGLNRPVHTITMFAASMGFQTVQQLGNRYILKYGVLMSHKASGGFDGDFGGGPSQLDSRYGLWIRRIDILDKDTVARTNGKQTLESYRAAYSNELWLNGEEAVKQGYADEVVTVKCDNSLSGSDRVEFETIFFSVLVDVPKCPINTSATRVSANIQTNKGKMELEQFLTNGGKFGKECRSSEEITNVGYDGSVNKLPSELCAVDPSLSIENVKKAIEERTSILDKEVSQVIKSY